MAFEFKKTTVPDLILITPHIFEDNRGYFIKDFEKSIFKENGIDIDIIETNESKSKKGTLRGLHFQQKYSQGKLIRVIKGSIFDVAVDLRFESSTFGKWQGFYLNEENHHMLYIPKGFAHGFLTLEDNTVFSYKCTEKYTPKYDSGILFEDHDIAVEWPFDLIGGKENLIISDKDKNLQLFSDFTDKAIIIE